MVDWSGGVLSRVQLYVNACNGWPQFVLQHHWLLPINCDFLRLYGAAGRGIANVSSAIEESDLYMPTVQEPLPWQPILGLKWAKSAESPSFVAVVFRNGLECRHSDF